MTTTREAALEAALKEIMSSDSYESRETFDGSSKHVVITKFGGFGQIAYEALAARPAPQPAGDTRGDCAAALAYASSLAETLHDKHYSRSVSWKPMPDLLGLLTQIDNMVAGIIGTATATPSDKIAEAARVPEVARVVEAYKQLLKDLTEHGGYTYEDDFVDDLAALRALAGKGE